MSNDKWTLFVRDARDQCQMVYSVLLLDSMTVVSAVEEDICFEKDAHIKHKAMMEPKQKGPKQHGGAGIEEDEGENTQLPQCNCSGCRFR